MRLSGLCTLALLVASSTEAAPHTSTTSTSEAVIPDTHAVVDAQNSKTRARRGFWIPATFVGGAKLVGIIGAGIGSAFVADKALEKIKDKIAVTATQMTATTSTTWDPTTMIPTERITQTTTIATPTTTTTTSESPSESCNICIGCSDIDVDQDDVDEVTFFPDFDLAQAGVPHGDKFDGLRELISGSGDEGSKIHARATDRDIDICGKIYKSPRYTSWDPDAKKSWPYYTSHISKRCPSYSFDLKQASTQMPGKFYAAEHIYEIQLIKLFLRWRFAQPDFVAYLGGEGSCTVALTLLAPERQWWQTRYFGGATGRPIKALLSQLSGDDRVPAEMVFLEDPLNTLKASMMAGKDLSTYNNYKENLRRAAGIHIVLQYLGTPAVSGIFKRVSGRVHTFYEELDSAIASSPNKAIIQLRKDVPTMKWADSYKTWVEEHLGTIATKTDAAINRHLGAAEAELNKLQGGEYKALLQNVFAREKDTFAPKPASHYLDRLE